MQPRSSLFVPSQKNCPIPMKYLDCVPHTNTNLESDQECRIEYVCFSDGARELSGSWTGTTGFDLLRPKPPEGCTWVGGRLTQKKRRHVQAMFGLKCGFAMNGRQRREAQGLWEIASVKRDEACGSRCIQPHVG
eukprot:10893668-Karenia_brevis.AAC.1